MRPAAVSAHGRPAAAVAPAATRARRPRRAGTHAAAAAFPPELLSAAAAARYCAAGGACCFLSHSAAVPVDVVKTRCQLDPARYPAPLAAAQTIVAEEGAGALLGGLGATGLGYLVQGSLKYGIFESLKGVVGGTLDAAFVADHRLVLLIACASTAELFGTSALCPFEAARIRMVAEPDFAPSLLAAMRKLAGDGLGPLYGGLPVILLKMVPYTVTQLVSYELATRTLYDAADAAGSGDMLAAYVPAAAALAAALAATVTSQPGDALLSEVNRMNALGETEGDGGGEFVPESLPAIALRLGRSGGLATGLSSRLAQYSLIVVTQLVTYDLIKVALGLGLTGR